MSVFFKVIAETKSRNFYCQNWIARVNLKRVCKCIDLFGSLQTKHRDQFGAFPLFYLVSFSKEKNEKRRGRGVFIF